MRKWIKWLLGLQDNSWIDNYILDESDISSNDFENYIDPNYYEFDKM